MFACSNQFNVETFPGRITRRFQSSSVVRSNLIHHHPNMNPFTGSTIAITLSIFVCSCDRTESQHPQESAKDGQRRALEEERSQIAAKNAQIAALTAERDSARAAEKAVFAAMEPLRENIDRLTRERDRLQAQLRSNANMRKKDD